jgi:hypothetical protein
MTFDRRILIPLAIGAAGVAWYLYRRKSGNATFTKGGTLQIQDVQNAMKFLPRSKAPRGVVIHHTHTANPKSTVRVLEQRGFSTNFEVDQAGRVYQYADPSTWEAQATGGGANAHTIGIDVTHVGLTAPFPPEQVAAVRALVHFLASRFGFPVRLAPDGQSYKWRELQSLNGAAAPTVYRHRNFVNTGCPANFPLEALA